MGALAGLLAVAAGAAALPTIEQELGLSTPAGDVAASQQGTDVSAQADLGASTSMIPLPLPVSIGAQAAASAQIGLGGADLDVAARTPVASAATDVAVQAPALG